MKPLGMLGGTSWHSTVEYYKLINQAINDAYGDNTNPPLLIYNLNQQRIHELQSKDHWDQISAVLADGVAKLQTAGAKGALFCANTPHKVYRQVAQTANIPILHIGDATGAAIREKGLRKVGLIGTLYTMEDGFIADWLREYYGVDTIVPDSAEVRKELHRIVQRELGVGIFKPETKSYVLAQIKQLHKRGAQGIVLGCTEFPLIIKQADVAIPAFDTTLLHSQMAVAFILGKPIPGNPTAVGTSGRK
ncbi:MAG: aspartate/glutamate racemase family protein [Bryobacteraceae bacterium]